MIIGVAGTAKNTGKTTALCSLIEAAYAHGRLPGVTGIGYDGEERDNVTLLPKPRITVFPGMIVTTSEQCLDASTARLRILRRSGYHTALGEVVVTVVEEGDSSLWPARTKRQTSPPSDSKCPHWVCPIFSLMAP